LSLTNLIRSSLTDTSLWQWQGEERVYLSCVLLQNWQHGFFTRQFWPDSPPSLTEILTPSASSYQLQQIHGNRVVKPSQAIKEGDGLISEQPREAIWVASADCTPILIGDIESGRVGAVHAGWRGTAQGIVREAVLIFCKEGSKLENLRIALGPAISGTVYQVGLEVATDVCSSVVSDTDNRGEILKIAEKLNPCPLQPDSHPNRILLDVPLVNYLQLLQMGINPEQMAIAPFCTYQQPEYFFSYRRTKEKKVQWSGIVSN